MYINIIGDHEHHYASSVYKNYKNLIKRISFELVELDDMINDYEI